MLYFKRDLFKFLKIIKHMLLTYAICFLTFGTVIYFTAKEAKNITSQFKLAVVDEEDSSISSMCFNILNNQQFSENITKFENVSLNDAKNGIKSGKYAVATVLEKGMIDKIRRGENVAFTLYVNDKYKMAYDVIKDISSNAIDMLISGQYGVFAGENVLYNINRNKFSNIDYYDFYNKYIVNSNLNLMSLALKGKDKIFLEKKSSYKKSNVSLVEFYVITLLVLVIFFGNISIYSFYKDDFNVPIISRLKSYKIKAYSFYTGKLILPSIFSYSLFLLILKISKITIFNMSYLIFILIGIFLINIFTLLCAIYMKSQYNYIIIIMTFTLLFTFLNGGIIPRSMMPYEVLNIVNYTPYGIIFSYFTTAISGSIDFKLIIYTIIYVFLSSILLIKAYNAEYMLK